MLTIILLTVGFMLLLILLFAYNSRKKGTPLETHGDVRTNTPLDTDFAQDPRTKRATGSGDN